MRLTFVFFTTMLLVPAVFGQDVSPGRLLFENRCARCHGSDGNGGDTGPAILGRLRRHNDQQLATLIHEGVPGGGMPPIQVSDAEMGPLIRFLRSLQARGRVRPVVHLKVRTTDNRELEGDVLNQGFYDLQLRTADQRVHLLRRAGDRYREVTSETGWPSYNGDPGGNRYTTLSQITPANVSRLGPKWMFTLRNVSGLEVTPVVVDGIMYVTSANECYALDAGTGREIWHFRRPRTKGITGFRHQPGRGRGRRSGLHGNRRRPHDRPQPLHGRAAVGYPDGRLAFELLRHFGPAHRREPGGRRRGRRGARFARLCGRFRPGHREGSLAILDHSQAR